MDPAEERVEMYAKDVFSACDGLSNGELIDILITVLVKLLWSAPAQERLESIVGCVNVLTDRNFYPPEE